MSPKPSDKGRLIKLGVIRGAHGIKGQVKIHSLTAVAEDITAYGALQDEHGRAYSLTITGTNKETLLATIEGVSDRNGAERLAGTGLFVPRSALPEPGKGEYYIEDLIGLQVTTADGASYGRVKAMHNFGAGDIAVIERDGREEEMLPFNKATFPVIDPKHHRLVIAPPESVQ